MKGFVFFSIALFSFLTTRASKYPYDWKVDRKQYELTADERAHAEIVLKRHTEYSYAIENDELVMYSVFHKIIRVNNSEAIQRNNRITISMEGTIDVLELKARAINSNGKAIVFDREHMKEIKDEESGKGYRMFAMEGVENGSEVEYLVIKKINPQVFGREYLQTNVPVKEASFLMKSPKHLEFEFRTYHGLPGVESKQVGEENIYSISATDLGAIVEEEFATADAWNQRIEYKLAYNRERSQARLYTWDYAGTEFYERIFAGAKDHEKAIKRFVETLRDDPSAEQQSRIRSAERQIKALIHVNEESRDESLSNLTAILKSKVASEAGIAKLFVATFSALNIPVQLVITCDRRYRTFDGTFNGWNFLDDYLLYFPEANTFLSPYNSELISPLIDPYYTGNKGLFIEPIEVASVKSALASVREIPANPWQYSVDRHWITINFNNALSENEIYFKNDMIGYKASIIAPYYDFISNEQQENAIEEFAKNVAPGISVDKWSAKTDFSSSLDKFSFDVKFTTAHFLERAGPRILLKLGLVIGPQAELYNTRERHLPVDNECNRGYERMITVTIPEGYKIKNPDDLNFNVLSTSSPDAPYSFVSSYKIEGQKLLVTINEYYKQISCPLESYEGFRKVVNAAADFNKVTLVLESVKR